MARDLTWKERMADLGMLGMDLLRFQDFWKSFKTKKCYKWSITSCSEMLKETWELCL